MDSSTNYLRIGRAILLVVAVILIAQTLLYGQSTQIQNQRKNKEEIASVIKIFFDGLREGDSTKIKSVFHPDGRLTSVSNNGALNHMTVNDFAAIVGKPHKELWDEKIFDVVVESDGTVGSVWCKYAFYLDKNFSHCGIDAFQVVRGESGWKIIQITDTRNKENCEEHKRKTRS